MSIDWEAPGRQPCPQCGRGPADKTCGVTVDERGGVAHCFRCGHVQVLHAKNRSPVRLARPPQPIHPPVRRHLSDGGLQIWRSTLPLQDVGRAYLESRCCVVPPADGHLRYHPSLLHPPSQQRGPALVALITNVLTGEPMSLHRTWIRADGSKVGWPRSRMLLAGHSTLRGVIRLWPDEEVTVGLGIAEGIETALSLAHAMTPVWACIDAGHLAQMPVLGGIESLMVAADHDETGVGLKAARTCAERWAAAGRRAYIAIPSSAGQDLNDIARHP